VLHRRLKSDSLWVAETSCDDRDRFELICGENRSVHAANSLRSFRGSHQPGHGRSEYWTQEGDCHVEHRHVSHDVASLLFAVDVDSVSWHESVSGLSEHSVPRRPGSQPDC
jgi:hypothetical protein